MRITNKHSVLKDKPFFTSFAAINKQEDHNMTNEDNSADLQNLFLNALRKEKVMVTIFLLNGVKLQGRVVAFDLFTLVLKREGQSQIIYKHAISTITSSEPFNLPHSDSDTA